MDSCKKRSIASFGKKFVCIEHVVDLLAFSRELIMEGVSYKGKKFGMSIEYKEDFLRACKAQDMENELYSSREG